MKMKYIPLALMALCFASCSTEENIPSSGAQQQAVRVTAGVGAHSRMVLNDQDTYTQSLWQNGDKISLFTSTQSNLVYSTSLNENSAVAEFTYVGDSLKYIEGNTVYACYPEVTTTTEDNLVVNLPATETIDYSDGVLRSFCYATDKITDGSLNFKFKHLSAFLFLTVTPEQLTDATKGISTVTVTTSSTSPLSIGGGDTFDFSTLTASTTHGSNTVQVNVGNQVITSDWTVYVPILPQPAGVNITVTMADSDGNVLYTLTKETPATGFVAGYVYKEGVTVTYEKAYLVDGPTFNTRIKQLANGSEMGIFDEDNMIEKIEFVTEVQTIPEEYVVVSAGGSPAPIYASFDTVSKLLTIFTPAKDMEIEDASNLFSTLKSLTTIDWGNFEINETTNSVYSMFYSCSSLVSLDVSKWNTKNVTEMNSLFFECSSLVSLDVSGWDTSSVTTMKWMFAYCSSLVSLDVSGWNTSCVVDITLMFFRCYSLVNLDVSSWDISKVTSLLQVFDGCSSLATLDVSGWDTSNVTDMTHTFNGCSSLTVLDVSAWNTSNVTDMNGLFGDCSSLTVLDVSGWNTSKVTSMRGLFYGCLLLVSLDVSSWDTSNVTEMCNMFGNCSSLVILDVSSWNTTKVRTIYKMFINCSSLTVLDVSGWDISNVTDSYGLSSMFEGCSSLSVLDVSNWDTSKVTDMSNLFYGCSSLTILDLTNWDTTNVTYMHYMFYNCTALTVLDISTWNVSNVVRMDYMFGACYNLCQLNIYGWVFATNVDLDNIFAECASTSQSCKIYLTPEAEEFLLGKLEDSIVGLGWFIWVNGNLNDTEPSFGEMPKVEI